MKGLVAASSINGFRFPRKKPVGAARFWLKELLLFLWCLFCLSRPKMMQNSLCLCFWTNKGIIKGIFFLSRRRFNFSYHLSWTLVTESSEASPCSWLKCTFYSKKCIFTLIIVANNIIICQIWQRGRIVCRASTLIDKCAGRARHPKENQFLAIATWGQCCPLHYRVGWDAGLKVIFLKNILIIKYHRPLRFCFC